MKQNLYIQSQSDTLYCSIAVQLCGCKNLSALFHDQMSYKATKPHVSLSYILACFTVLLFIMVRFLSIVNLYSYVFSILVVLVLLL